MLAKQRAELTIDDVSKDEVLEAGYSAEARERARQITSSFEQFIQRAQGRDHRRFSSSTAGRTTSDCASATSRRWPNAIAAPPQSWTPERLWHAYETLDQSKVRGSGQRILTDIVSLVRFALHQEPELVPFRERVEARFAALAGAAGAARARTFTAEQRRWLELIRDHITGSFQIDRDDFDYSPFVEQGGLGKVYQVFGAELYPLMDEIEQGSRGVSEARCL